MPTPFVGAGVSKVGQDADTRQGSQASNCHEKEEEELDPLKKSLFTKVGSDDEDSDLEEEQHPLFHINVHAYDREIGGNPKTTDHNSVGTVELEFEKEYSDAEQKADMEVAGITMDTTYDQSELTASPTKETRTSPMDISTAEGLVGTLIQQLHLSPEQAEMARKIAQGMVPHVNPDGSPEDDRKPAAIEMPQVARTVMVNTARTTRSSSSSDSTGTEESHKDKVHKNVGVDLDLYTWDDSSSDPSSTGKQTPPVILKDPEDMIGNILLTKDPVNKKKTVYCTIVGMAKQPRWYRAVTNLQTKQYICEAPDRSGQFKVNYTDAYAVIYPKIDPRQRYYIFKKILSHKLEDGEVQLEMQWQYGAPSYIPLENAKEGDPLMVTDYALKNHLLEEPHWSDLTQYIGDLKCEQFMCMKESPIKRIRLKIPPASSTKKTKRKVEKKRYGSRQAVKDAASRGRKTKLKSATSAELKKGS